MAENFQLKALITGVDKLSPTLAGIRKNVASFRKNIEGTGLGKIGFKEALAGGALAAPFIVGAKAAIEFESAMADVRKVVNFDNPGQFKEMGDDIGKMSERLPMAANDIAKIVAAGGQAGIARSELLGFAQDAVKMGIAFDQTAEESGQMMSTWRTGFSMTQPEVVALADKINYLGNTGPANAQKISAIVTRIGPMGRVAGVASGQIAALGATLGGMGVEQEVASTAIKNLMTNMTQGAAATKSQQQAFKSLRLSAKQVAKSMQVNAQGTILDLFDRIRDVKPEAQLSVLTELFGTESAPALAMLLTNLGLLKGNLKKVADAQQYGGSMETEYASRAATTENNLILLRGAADNVSRALGQAFLPAINGVVNGMRPLISRIGDFIRDNPELVQGIAAAGVAFTVLRLGIVGATVATKLLSLALGMTPIGIVALAIAAAVGVIVANWDRLAPYFTQLWATIKTTMAAVWTWIKAAFAWTPLGQIVANWQPLMQFFSALWDFIKAAAAAGWEYLKEQIGFDPVQVVSAAWEPLVAWFKGFFDRVRPYIEPLMNAGEWVGGKVSGAADWVKGKATGAADFFSGNDGSAVGAGLIAQGTGGLQGATQSLLTGRGNKAQLDGALVVRFENAPAGMRPEAAQTNQPGLKVTTNVGYRSLSGAQ